MVHAGDRYQKRPTIGVLVDWLDNGYQSTVLKGVISEAQANDINVFCFVGRGLEIPDRFADNANFVYNLPVPENVDGLLIFAGNLGYYNSASVVDLCHRYEPLPVVCLGQEIEGVANVVVDNEIGSYEAVNHLITEHGIHRIVYAKGPEGHLEAEQRYLGYLRALHENGIDFDPDLIVSCGFLYAEGKKCARRLLDERRVEFEAVVAASDLLAIGIAGILQERGYRIPEDIAVIGFDDLDVAAAFTPPLATVHQPKSRQGAEGVRLLLSKIRGDSTPDRVDLPTRLMVRRSCGCLSPWITGVEDQVQTDGIANLDDLRRPLPDTILSHITTPIRTSFVKLPASWPSDLLHSFVDSIRDNTSVHFLSTFNRLLDEVIAQGGKISEWQGVISAVRQVMLPALKDDQTIRRAENLFHQARVMISESTFQVQVNKEASSEEQNVLIRQLVFELVSTLHLNEQMMILSEHLPFLGIREGYLALFEDKRWDSEWSRLVMAYTPDNKLIAADEGIRFPTHQLIAADYRVTAASTSYVVLPIFLQDEQIGLLILDLCFESLSAYEIVRAVTSSAIKSEWLYRELQSYSDDLKARVQNVTAELVRSKERAETILDNSPDAILLLDSSRFIETGNSTCETILGCQSNLLAGKHPLSLVANESKDALAMALSQLSESHEPIRLEVIANHRSGHSFDAEIALAPITESGKFNGAVCMIRDITALKDLERVKDALLSTAAHELRTPLTTIRGFTEILLTRELVQDRRTRYLQYINNQSTHLGGLVDNLLDVARIQAGRGLDMSFEPVDIGEVIRMVAQSYDVAGSGHTFKLDNIDDGLRVNGDPLRLDQVVRNLVSNAIKYSPRGGTVTIRIDERDSRAEVSVRDEGIGMSPEVQAHLFERFYRADRSNSAVSGVGLGLTICKQIVEKHGGDIWAESEPGKGSTFTFSIPTVQRE
ncbi:MAG: substrate-binding domain-containing protein [Anaerolineae bacterium]|nr:substrate-binding domain-containing protein [Anaerolineae bacterium]